MFRIITSREDYKLRPRFRNPSPSIPSFADFVLPGDFLFHLDAADAVQGATSWTSKEGKVFTGLAITKTANAINGLPSVQDASYHWDAAENFNLTNGHTVFVVGRHTTLTTFQRMVSCAALNTADFQTTGGTVPLILDTTTTWGTMHPGVGYVSRLSIAAGTNYVLASRRDGANVTNYSWSGANVLTGPTQNMGTVSGNFRRIAIGKDPYSGGQSWNGIVCEVVFYSRHLSNVEFDTVRDFLRVKYAL